MRNQYQKLIEAGEAPQIEPRTPQVPLLPQAPPTNMQEALAQYLQAPNALNVEFKKAFEDRQAMQRQNEEMRRMELERDFGGLQGVNLAPAMALVDNLTGSNLGQSYKAPTQMAESDQRAEALRQAAQKLGNQGVDDQMRLAQLNSAGLKNNFDAFRQIENDRANNQYKQDIARARMGGSRSGSGFETTFTKEVDKKFAKEYVDWTTGGFANVKENLGQLNNAVKVLSGDDQMGKRVAPQFLRKYNPLGNSIDSVKIEQDIQRVTYESLKEILGGAFSKAEGDALVRQAYDPGLGDAQNTMKVQSTIRKLQDMADAKQQATAYAAKNGTLRGFQGQDIANMDEYLNKMKSDLRTDLGLDASPQGGSFTPTQVMNDAGEIFTIESPEELQEAMAEGFKPVGR